MAADFGNRIHLDDSWKQEPAEGTDIIVYGGYFGIRIRPLQLRNYVLGQSTKIVQPIVIGRNCGALLIACFPN